LAAQRSEVRHLLSQCMSVRLTVCLSHLWCTRFKTSKYTSHHMTKGCL